MQVLEQPLRDRDGLGLAGDILEQDRELVPAEPRGRVAGTDRDPEPLADRLQDLIPGGMPESVGEELEVVEIEEEHRDPPRAPTAQSIEDMIESVQEQASVGQARQRVAVGLVVNLVVEPCVLERDGCLTGEQLGELEALLAEHVGLMGRQLEDADRFAADHERQDDHALLADGAQVFDLELQTRISSN